MNETRVQRLTYVACPCWQDGRPCGFAIPVPAPARIGTYDAKCTCPYCGQEIEMTLTAAEVPVVTFGLGWPAGQKPKKEVHR